MKGEWVKTEKFVLGPFWSFLESRMKFLKVQSLLPKSGSVLWLVYVFNHSFQQTFVGKDCVTSQKNICKGGYNTTYKGIAIRVGTINLSLAKSLSLCLQSWRCYTKEINFDYSLITFKLRCRLNAGLKQSIHESNQKSVLFAEAKADRRLNLTFPPAGSSHQMAATVNHGRQSYAFGGWSDSPVSIFAFSNN